MRFRYFDSEGAEVPISSVDALKFRIGSGAVTPETLLYDKAVGRWAPAWHHQVVRFLVQEGGGDLLPDAARREWEEVEDRVPPDPVPRAEEGGGDPPPVPDEAPPPDPPGPAPRSTEGRGGSASPAPTDAHDAPPAGGAAEGSMVPADRSPGEDSGVPPADDRSQDPLAFLDPEASSAETGPAHTADDSVSELGGGPEPVEQDPEPVARSTQESGSEAPASAGGTDGEGGRRDPDRGSNLRGRVREIDVPVPLVRRSGGGDAREGGGSSGETASSVRVRSPWILAGVVAVVGAVGLALLGDGDPDALAAPRGSPVERAASASAAVVAEPDRPAGEAGTPDARGSASGSTTVAGQPGAPAGTPPPSETEVEALVPEVAGAASGDLARAMDQLQDALGVPERPPSAWLQGAYLADAAAYPDVRTYWRAYRAYVASVRAVEEDLYRGFVQNRILRMRLDTAVAADLSARILERYQGAGVDRARVYGDLEALADAALALHDTLAERRESISYEPFSGGELSRDPVVEAVADDPQLADEIWGRLDRIFELLERVQGLRPVSTLRLQEALLGGLEVPDPGG